jgi:lysophospholipase L1-like esterase
MDYQLAAIGLAPVLYAQAVYTRRVTPRLPEPDGPRQGLAGTGQPLRLLIAGDSAAAGVGAATQAAALSGRLVSTLAQQFCVSWQLMARTGIAIADLVAQLEAAPRQAFDVCVLSVGVNDVTRGTSARRWLELQGRLVELLTMEFEVRHVLLACIPPMQYFPALPHPLGWYLGKRSAHLNQLSLDGVRRHPRCEFVDPGFVPEPRFIATDGFHPGPDAYEWWAQHLSGRIVQRWC